MAEEAAFGHYRLLALLGRGGMGEVWRAQDTRKDRHVALKILGAWLGAEPDYTRRFRREAALAARLNAPNIIPIHDYGEIDGKLFIEMPLIVGADLDELITREGPLDPARAVDVIEQVAAALDAAHDEGLVHRDVKPSNVLVTAHRGRDFAYLIDFGIARSADGTRLTTTGRELGTLAYMAPERFNGGGDDRRGDVYALACVLFQALVGQPPFVPPDQAHRLAFYLNAHLHQPPPQPSASNPALPEAWDAVIAHGMAKDPEQRYPSAGEFAAAAHTVLTDTRPRDELTSPGATRQSPPGARYAANTVSADAAPAALGGISAPFPTQIATTTGPRSTETLRRPPPQSGRPSRARWWSPRRRRRLTILAALILVAAVATSLVWVVGGGVVPTPPSSPTPVAAPAVERQLTGHTALVGAVTTAELDGRPVVISGSDDKTVRVWDLATGQPIGAPFTGHDAVDAVATAQLNGRTVVISGGHDGTLQVWDLATRQPVESPLTGHTGPVIAVASTQLDGRPVVISAGDKTVRVWDLTTGKPIGSPAIYDYFLSAMAVAQLGGHLVVITAIWADYKMEVRDLTTGQPIGSPINLSDITLATTQLDGRPVAVGGSSTVHVYDLATARPVGPSFTGSTDLVLAVATAQLDGRPVVISGSRGHTLQMWDLATGKQLGPPIAGHTGRVFAVATAQLDGRPVVISGSEDNTVRVWDLEARARS